MDLGLCSLAVGVAYLGLGVSLIGMREKVVDAWGRGGVDLPLEESLSSGAGAFWIFGILHATLTGDAWCDLVENEDFF